MSSPPEARVTIKHLPGMIAVQGVQRKRHGTQPESLE